MKEKYLSELPKEEFEMGEVDIADNMLTRKDGEILFLLNQIASDMVKRSDVNKIVKEAVTDEYYCMVTYYEEKKAMAAKYEVVIALIKKKDKGGKKIEK